MKIAVIFPGIGYHPDKPLLYFARMAAKAQGYQVVNVTYGNFPRQVKGSPEKMKAAFLSAVEQAETELEGIDFHQYDDILFISKSVGTAVAAAYGRKHGLKTRNVYYTPIGESFDFIQQEGIVFHGTKDGWVETDVIREKCEKGHFPLYITENGNHSLETGEVDTDLANLQKIMKITQQYIAER